MDIKIKPDCDELETIIILIIMGLQISVNLWTLVRGYTRIVPLSKALEKLSSSYPEIDTIFDKLSILDKLFPFLFDGFFISVEGKEIRLISGAPDKEVIARQISNIVNLWDDMPWVIKCYFSLSDLYEILKRINGKSISVGAGRGALENCAEFDSIDPGPTSFDKGPVYREPIAPYLTEENAKLYDILLLIWPDPSLDYDIKAVNLRKWNQIVVLVELRESGGSKELLDFLRNPKNGYSVSYKIDKVVENFDGRKIYSFQILTKNK